MMKVVGDPCEGAALDNEDWKIQLQDVLMYQSQFASLISMVVFMYVMGIPEGRDAVGERHWKRCPVDFDAGNSHNHGGTYRGARLLQRKYNCTIEPSY